jgi:hypothetical protein
LSADEASQIHEEMGQTISTFVTPNGLTIPGKPSAHDWPYLFAPAVLLVIFVVMLWIKKDGFFNRETWARFAIGL